MITATSEMGGGRRHGRSSTPAAAELPTAEEPCSARIGGAAQRITPDGNGETGCRTSPGTELRGAFLEVSLSAGVSEGERRSVVIESLEAWYETQARAALLDRVRFFAPLLGVEPKTVRVRNQKTRWGSCGKDGTLYFSWRLIMALPTVVDYLVVHELCHLQRPGHGRAFWSLVASVLPDYQERRVELRRDGWRYRLR